MPPTPPPHLAAFAAELAGQGGPPDDLLVAEAVAAAVRLRVLHAAPRLYLPHTVDRSWDRDHDLASRAYFRTHKALRSARSSTPNHPRPTPSAPRSTPGGVTAPPQPAGPTPSHPAADRPDPTDHPSPWREFAQSTINRMGLPGLTIGTFEREAPKGK